MTLKRTLTALVNAIVEEAERNHNFRTRIEQAFDVAIPVPKATTESGQRPAVMEKRKGGRRTPAVLDPVELAKNGETGLRNQLADLDLEKLLDIVAQYGMDPGKLVMKWKDRERVIDRIVELAMGRATKGEAFSAD